MRLNIKLFILLIVTSCFSAQLQAKEGIVIDSLVEVLAKVKGKKRVDVYNQIAYEYKNVDIQKTAFYADSSIWLANELKYKDGEAAGYVNRAIFYKFKGDTTNARSCLVWAYAMNSSNNNIKGLSSTLNGLGSLNMMQGRLKAALSCFLSSLKLSEQINDKMGMARTLNNIGVINLELKNYSKALEYYERAYYNLKEVNDENSMADALNNIGNVYHLLGINEESLKYYFKALEINNRLGDLRDKSANLTNIGIAYYKDKQYKTALKYHLESLALDEKVGDQQSIAIACNNLANCYIELGMYFAARKYALRSASISQTYNSQGDLMISFLSLYTIEDKLGNYKEALDYYKLYNTINDSLYSQEIRNQLELMEQQYQAEKTENEKLLRELDKEGANQPKGFTGEMKRQIQIFTIVLVSFVTLVFIIFFIIRKNKRS
ncbi:MAG: tetratricopeptide repeat protein [Bacteroidia bacterium]|jgi:tetratricopeptide (TPR) repeat protein|nr:tetratricopeptide repeat protein [Bacteroidia bacterium]